jgi:hypothetical protein
VVAPFCAAAAAALPAQAAAASQGPCTVAYAQSGVGAWAGGKLWHVDRTGTLGLSVVTATSTVRLSVDADFYGIAVPVGTYTGRNGGAGINLVPPGRIAPYTRVFDLTTSTGSCVATVSAVIDGVGPLGSLAGRVGLLASALGLLGVLLTLIGRRRIGKRTLGAIFGLIAGIGIGLLLQELGLTDPDNPALLAAPILTLIVAAALPGVRRRSRRASPVAASPSSPAPPPRSLAPPPPPGTVPGNGLLGARTAGMSSPGTGRVTSARATGRVPARLRALGATLITLTVAGCAAIGAPSTVSFPRGDVITPSQAQAVADQLVPQFETAVENNDAAAMANVTVDPELTERTKAITDEAPRFTAPSSLQTYTANAEVAVPHQSGYPAVFAAIVTVSSRGHASTAVFCEFTKPSAQSSWRIDRLVDVVTGAAVPKFATDSRGYAYTMPGDLVESLLAWTPTSLATAWSDDMSAVLQSGAVTAGSFAASWAATGFAHQCYTSERTVGAQQYGESYATLPGSTTGTVWRTADGGALLPFTVQYQEILLPPLDQIQTPVTTSFGTELTIPLGVGMGFVQNEAQTNLGGLLAPFAYPQIFATFDADVLAYIPPTVDASRPQALGIDGEVVAKTGPII